MSRTRSAEATEGRARAQIAERRRRRRVIAGSGSERRDGGEEARKPAGLARLLHGALAAVGNARVGHADGGDAVVLVDIGQADDARYLHPFLSLAEIQHLFAAHQRGAVRADLRNRHGQIAPQRGSLRGSARSVEGRSGRGAEVLLPDADEVRQGQPGAAVAAGLAAGRLAGGRPFDQHDRHQIADLLQLLRRHVALHENREGLELVQGAEPSLDGSLWQQFFCGSVGGELIPLDLDVESSVQSFTRALVGDGVLVAARNVGSGGLAVSLAKMLFNADCAVGLQCGDYNSEGELSRFFGEGPSSLILACPPDQSPLVQSKAASSNIQIRRLGSTGGKYFQLGDINLPLNSLYEGWLNALNPLMGISNAPNKS